MRLPLGRALVLAAFMLALTCGLAAARTPQLRGSTPAADAILDGSNLQFVIRFDAPVDHAAARLEVTQDGILVETVHALLDSEPDVVFGASRALPPGHYALHWKVGEPFGGDVAEGEIPFSVGR